eukprot:4716835-Ditylum_brightwellii.AAC.1
MLDGGGADMPLLCSWQTTKNLQNKFIEHGKRCGTDRIGKDVLSAALLLQPSDQLMPRQTMPFKCSSCKRASCPPCLSCRCIVVSYGMHLVQHQQ